MEMKKVGEVGFGAMAQAKKGDRKTRAAAHGVKKAVFCKECGVRMMMSADSIKRYGEDKRCYVCFQKGQEEVKQAMINLAKRKGLVK